MKREIEGKLKTMLADPNSQNVIMVEGARQVGKSYLLNRVLTSQDRPFVAYDLEKNSELRRQIDKTVDFKDFQTLMTDQYGVKKNSILFLDEAQESRQLSHYVKSFKEDWPEVKIILTGSSMNRFFSEEIRIPVGRTRSLTVFCFNFSEFIEYTDGEELADFLRSAPEEVAPSRHQLLLEKLDKYMLVGGYPEAVIAYQNKYPYYEVIDEIMASLEEDFQRKESENPGLFREVIRGVANHIGSPSKLTHFDTTKYKAKKIIDALIGWHLVLEVTPHSLDPQHSSYLPKRYLHDIGVVNRKRTLALPAVSVLETIVPLLRIPLGGLFENSLIIGLMAGEPVRHEIGTWKKGKNSDIEVDVVLDVPEHNAKIPIECKAALTLKSKHYKNVLHYLKLTGQTFGVVVSAAPLQKIVIDDSITIMNIPLYLASKGNIRSYYLRHVSG